MYSSASNNDQTRFPTVDVMINTLSSLTKAIS